jgi:phosphomevalonate kinase
VLNSKSEGSVDVIVPEDGQHQRLSDSVSPLIVPQMGSRETVVSCPGKVLIAGGYLVLDPAYSGLAVATSSRFYTVARSLSSGTATSDDAYIHICVKSPQFSDGRWSFELQRQSDDDHLSIQPSGCARRPSLCTCTLTQVHSSGRNKFVEIALRESIKFASCVVGIDALFQALRAGGSADTLDLTIVGDNDFYSQARLVNPFEGTLFSRPTFTYPQSFSHGQDDPSRIPPFNPLNVAIADVHKTGLGSSAAMVSSLVSAICLHISAMDTSLPAGSKETLHNLAQYVHSLAQGKVGSGFDVSAAIYGTQVYRRFEPAMLDTLLSSNTVCDTISPLHYTV